MLKVFLSFALACSMSLGDEIFTIKVKDEFKAEFKELMQKYQSDGKVQLYKQNVKKSPNILQSFLNSEDTSGDIALGKTIYEKTCYRCHGKNADTTLYPSARVLNTLDKTELYDALMSYKTDSSYGKATKFIMSQQASALTSSEMSSVSAYIYSLTHSFKEASKQVNQKADEEENTGVQGTYLK